MPATVRPRRITAVSTFLALVFLTGCGGGGGGGGAPATSFGLSFANPRPVYRIGVDIVPNVPEVTSGSGATSWAVDPALPSGLLLDAATGVISGTPSSVSFPTSHRIAAQTPSGEIFSVVVIEVRRQEQISVGSMESYSDDDVRHFLERTHFGFSQAAYDLIAQHGIDWYLDWMTGLLPQTAFETQAFQEHLRDENDPEGKFPSHTDLARWWLFLIQSNPNPFQEVLALHWHDHFATSSDVLDNSKRWWFVNHVNLWRHRGAGNLRRLLIDMARDWAMLEWLDGRSNNGALGHEPNENFAREFFELFCLGRDNGYDENDIVEAARAFSGYKKVFDGERDRIEFDPSRHDAQSKVVLGSTIAGQSVTDDYEAVVDATLSLQDPASGVSRCARWIVRQLLSRFVYVDPPEEVVQDFARMLQEEGWELRPVLVALFKSETFYSAHARVGIVKAPTEHAIGFIRATGLSIDVPGLESRLQNLNDRPTQPPGVQGWPEGVQWLSSQAMVDRANLLRYVITRRSFQEQRGIHLESLFLGTIPQAPEVVDVLAARLHVPLLSGERQECIDYLNTQRDGNGEVTPSPFDPTRTSHIDERVRGLLYILGQHPEFMTK